MKKSFILYNNQLLEVASNYEELVQGIKDRTLPHATNEQLLLAGIALTYYESLGWFGGFCADMHKIGFRVQPDRACYENEVKELEAFRCVV